MYCGDYIVVERHRRYSYILLDSFNIGGLSMSCTDASDFNTRSNVTVYRNKKLLRLRTSLFDISVFTTSDNRDLLRSILVA